MTDLERWKLRGPVRNMRSEIAEWDRDRQDWLPPFPQTSVTFDERGNAKELEQGVGESVYRTTYTYDATGRLSATQGGTDEKIEYASRYSYDEAGRLTRIVDIDESGAQRTSATYSYTDGRKTEVTFLPEEKPNLAVHHQIEGSETGYSAPGARTVTTSYDDEGRPSEAVFHGAAHTPLREIVLTRDSSGRVIREAAVVPDGAMIDFQGAMGPGQTLSSADHEKLATLFTAAFGSMITTFAYDSRGRILQRARTVGQAEEEWTTFTYDDYDNPILEITERRSREMAIGDDGDIRTVKEEVGPHHTRYEYDYDARGNWTRRVVSWRSEAGAEFQRSNVERRAITYY